MVCAQDPHPPKLIESENRRDIRDEPIFKPGSPVTVASPKNIPPAPPNEEPSLIDGVKWHDTESISLAAQKKKVITVEVDSRSWLLVKVDWHGAGVPVQVTLRRGSSVIASGTPIATGAGMGRTSMRADLKPGKFLISIQNVSQRPANLDIAIGSVPPKERSSQ
jgi:hypothetical protein